MHGQDATAEVREREEALIRAELGSGAAVGITYVDEGWDSRVYVVDGGAAVFKFPRFAQARAQYRHEIAVLRMLEGTTTGVRTPIVRWVGPELAYFGYAGIVGAPLSNVMAGLDAEAKVALGSALGRFLRLLHSAQLDDAPVVSVEEEVATYAEKFGLGRAALQETFSAEEMRCIDDFSYVDLPAELRRLGGALELSHGDLGPWNLIVAPDGDVGVIDFGDVGYHDESKDFSGFGDDVITRAAFTSYGAGARLREKASLRAKALPLLDLPFYLGKRDRAGTRACLELVRRVIVEGHADDRFTRD